MPSSEYFRRQAETCLRLACASSDDETAQRLLKLAEEYRSKAAQIDAASPLIPPASVAPSEQNDDSRR
jgi:hypothetical protein